MAYISQNDAKQKVFAREFEGTFQLNVFDVAVLLFSIWKCATIPSLGHVDADYTLERLTSILDIRRIQVPQHILESALYCCNMLQEQKKFIDPKGRPFARFIEDLIGSKNTFDRKRHLISLKEKKDNGTSK